MEVLGWAIFLLAIALSCGLNARRDFKDAQFREHRRALEACLNPTFWNRDDCQRFNSLRREIMVQELTDEEAAFLATHQIECLGCASYLEKLHHGRTNVVFVSLRSELVRQKME
ncbi:MAG: hypothetical protein HY001_03100 [Candidatus Portnoybacteria bacterium]|nr:hypothetical protein [Candidatus Portnoybacteria bacterium]